ncbi:hypothetical protein, partial [Veillonella magna]
HPEVSTSAQVLWYVLMHYNNTCSWKKQFSVPMSMLMTSTRLSESSVKRARLALQKAGRIRYSVRPGKKATVYEMISMEEEGIVTSFLSGNSAAIAVDMSDSEEIVSEEIDIAGVVNLAEEDAKGTVSEKVISEKVISEEVDAADAGNADQRILQDKDQCDLQNKDQNISRNEGQSIPKIEDKKDGLGELLPERLPERRAERLPERILKLNKTKLDISKESTKKGSEAILVEPQEKCSDETQTLHTEVVEQQKYCSNETQAMNNKSWQDMIVAATDTLNIKRIILNDVIYLMQMCNSR